GPWLLGRIDVEARALAEVIAIIVGNVVTARARVGCDEDQTVLGAGGAILALLGDVRVRAGQARQGTTDRYALAAFGLRRCVDRKGNVRRRHRRRMLDDKLSPAVRLVLGEYLHPHSVGMRWSAQSLLPSGSRT